MQVGGSLNHDERQGKGNREGVKWIALRKLVQQTKQLDPIKLGRSHFVYIDISSLDRESKLIVDAQQIRVLEAPSRARKLVATNDILVSTVRPNLNNVARIPSFYDGEIASTGFCVLRSQMDVLDHAYLFYFCQSSGFIRRLSSLATGAGYPAVTDSVVLDTLIPLPPLDEQRRIAQHLLLADRQRRLRRYALELSEAYLQAVFLEMFGDLRRNDRNWQFHPLKHLSDVVSGVTKGRKFIDKRPVQVPYLRVANVQAGYLDLSEIKLIEALPEELLLYQLEAGDVVMTEGGDFDKLGRGAIWQQQLDLCIHQNHIFRVRLERDQIIPEYFAQLLQSDHAKSYFLTASKQTTNLASINISQLKALPVPLPPLPLQQDFARIAHQHERLRTHQREARRQADHLFDTLLHRAFNGD